MWRLRIVSTLSADSPLREPHGKHGTDGGAESRTTLIAAASLARAEEAGGVIDVWESRDAFDRFLASRLQPALQELGDRTFQVPPDIKEFPVQDFTKP